MTPSCSSRATPTGMSKLLRMWKSWKTASPAVFEGVAVALNTVARTKREGGVKSPGAKHAGALPHLTNGRPIDGHRRHVARMELDIVAQVDHMPVESRRVGDDPQRIVRNLELSIERL